MDRGFRLTPPGRSEATAAWARSFEALYSKPYRENAMRISAIYVISALAAGYAVSAPAQPTNPNYARDIAATCTACHGTDGRSVGGIPPSLAGQDRKHLLQALKDFKAGQRAGTT